jgi:hypothetical protein
MVAPRPGAGNGTASNPMVDERKGEHGGKEEWLRSGGQKADSGRSALASSAGERDDREAGAAMGVPPGIVGTSVNSAPEESLIGAGSGWATTEGEQAEDEDARGPKRSVHCGGWRRQEQSVGCLHPQDYCFSE